MIKLGKLKFEESNEPAGVEDLFGEKAKKALREIVSRQTAIRRDEISISKVGRGEAEGSSTTKRSKERLCELNQEEKNKMLYRMIQELEQMLKEQKEYSATLREENR